MIGTNDLCAELGIPSQFTHAKIVDAYEKVIAAAKKHGKWVGSGGVPTEEGMAQYVRMGVRFLLSGADFAFMMAAGTARAKALRALDQAGR
jgi:2-keto-3-deoxy-L-rhamnonate aldolase RhmA